MMNRMSRNHHRGHPRGHHLEHHRAGNLGHLDGIRRAVWLFVAILVALVSASPADATEPKAFPDIQRILDSGKLTVAVVNQLVPPVIDRDEDGNLAGFDIQLAQAIAESLGVTAEFVQNQETYDGVVDAVSRGEADIAASFISRTTSRSKFVLFSRPYLIQQQTVLINRLKGVSRFRHCPSREEIIEIAKWPGQLGVLKDSSFAQTVEDVVPEGSPAEFDSYLDQMAAVYQGDIVVSYQGELWAEQFLTRNAAFRIRLKVCPIGKLIDNIAIAVRPDAPNLLAYINIFLEEHHIQYDVDELIAQEGDWTFAGH